MTWRREVWAWALYDWANSAFATTIMAGFFPLFFKAYWSDPSDPARSTFTLGAANSLAAVLVAALAPFMGAVADHGGARKRFLGAFTLLGAAASGALLGVGQGDWTSAVLLYVLGTIGFSGSLVFYDALLPGVAPGEEGHFVSSLGYALGYVGGGLLFAANVLMYLKPELLGIAGPAQAVKLSFLTVAGWWLVFAVPIFLWVPEPRFQDPVPLAQAVPFGWRRLIDTLRQARRLKTVGLFLLAYWCYIDGVDTVVKMAVDYGMSLGFDSKWLIAALLMVQVIAFPAALAYVWVARRLGVKQAILAAIGAYGLITVMACFMTRPPHFLALAAVVGLFQGGIQALSRSLYAQIIPRDQSAQFFGFYNMLGKFAAVLGPVLMGGVTLATGSPRAGILSILVLFVAGGLLLWSADLDVKAPSRN